MESASYRLGEALGALAVPLLVSYVVGMLAFCLMFPWLCISALRNVKQIRLQLERLNEILESRLSADATTPTRR